MQQPSDFQYVPVGQISNDTGMLWVGDPSYIVEMVAWSQFSADFMKTGEGDLHKGFAINTGGDSTYSVYKVVRDNLTVGYFIDTDGVLG